MKKDPFLDVFGGPKPPKSSNFGRFLVKNRDFGDTKTVSGVHIIYIAMCSWGGRKVSPAFLPLPIECYP